MKRDIILSGVGGQGILSIAAVIGRAALEDGLHIKQAEVHGMSQRGGSVVTYVRYGEGVASPVICEGEADVILSFEMLEAARWLPYLRTGGTIVTGTQKINPMPVITGAAKYPEEIDEKIRALGVKLVAEDAAAISAEAGSEKAANVALIGLAAHVLGFDADVLRKAVEDCVPAKAREINLRAFDAATAKIG